jgi:hypothetical protein
MRRSFSTSNRSDRSYSAKHRCDSQVRRPMASIMERLEDRTLLSNTYSLSNGNLIDNGVTVASNVVQYSIGRSGFAYYIQTNNNFWINEGASPADDYQFGAVYQYGIRSDGDGYYWAQADNHLYVNGALSTSYVDTNPIKGFGVRGDGSGYFWDANNNVLYLNSASTNFIVIDGGGIKGFGVRHDGVGIYWDSGNSELFYNPTNTTASYSVWPNYGSPTGSPVQKFAVDAAGDPFFIPSGQTAVWENAGGIGPDYNTVCANDASAIVSSFQLTLRVPNIPEYGGYVSYITNGSDPNGTLNYEPLYGGPTATFNGGPTITSSTVPVYLIFWGSNWGSASPSTSSITSAARTLLSSNYLTDLAEYTGSTHANLAGTDIYSASNPSNPFTDTSLQQVVTTVVHAMGWPESSASNSPIYLVVTPNGVSVQGNTDANGYHSDLTDGTHQVVYGWIGNPTSGPLNSITPVIGHEVAEAISDPEPTTGWSVTPGINWPLGGNEIADAEAELYQSTLANSSVLVQSYWSEKTLAFIIDL